MPVMVASSLNTTRFTMPYKYASRLRRWRAAALGLLVFVVAVVGLLQLSPVATWVARRLTGLVPLNPGYVLEVGKAGGNWFGGLVLEDVALVHRGRELTTVGRLDVRYRLRELVGTPRRLRTVDLDRVRVTAHRVGGRWDVTDAFRKSTDTTSGGGFAVDLITLRDGAIVAQAAPDSVLRIRGLAMVVRDLRTAGQATAKVDRLNLALLPPRGPEWFAVSARGEASGEVFAFDPVRIQTERSDVAARIVVPRRLDETRLIDLLDVRLKASPLALADVAPFVPAVTPRGSIGVEASASGSGSVVAGRLDATAGKGTIALGGSTSLQGGKLEGLELRGTITELDPSTIARSGPAGSINATLDAHLKGRLDSATGSAALHVAHSRIGSRAIDTLQLRTTIAGGRATVKLRGAYGPGSLAADGWITPFDSLPSYRLSGSATGLPGTGAAAKVFSGTPSDSVLEIRFLLSGRGLAPAHAYVDGRVDLASLRRSGERVNAGHATLTLHNGRLLARPDIVLGGGRITAVATARLGDTVSYRVTHGVIDHVDLGRMAGDSVSAPLDVTFSLRGSGTAPNEAVAEGQIRLDSLRYGGVRIDTVVANARLERGQARIAVRGGLQGGRLAADATARPFDSTASFDLRRLALDSVDLGTMIGRPALAGPVTMRGKARGRLGEAAEVVNGEIELEPSRMGRISVASGTLRAFLDGQRLAYEASVATSGGSLALAGDGRPLAESPAYTVRRGRVDSIDLGSWLGRAGLRTDLNATFRATLSGLGGTASAAVADRMRANLDALVLPSTVNDATLDRGKASFALDSGQVDGTIVLEGADGRLDSRADGRLSASGSVLRTSGSLALEHLARWTGRKAADGRLEGRFALEANADSMGLRSIGGTASAFGGIGGVKLLGARLVLSPFSGGLKVDTLRVRSNVAALDGVGTVALRRSAPAGRLTITGRFANVEPLAALAGPDTVSLDSVIATLRLTGPASHRRVDARGQAFSLLASGLLADRIGLAAQGGLDSTGLADIRGRLTVKDAVYGKVEFPALELSGRYDSLIAVGVSAAVGDSIHLAAALQGTVAGDTIRAVLQKLDIEEPSRRWTLRRPARIETGPRTKVDDLALVSGTGQITLRGMLDLKDSSDLALTIRGLDLASYRSAGLSPIAGRLDGNVRLAGPPRFPAITGKVGLAIVDSAGKEAGKIGADVIWRRAGLQLRADAIAAAGGRLTVAGTLPYRLTLAPGDTSQAYGVERGDVDTVALSVRADSFNLSLFGPLLPPDVATGLFGALAADAHLGGRLDAPEARGTVSLTGATLTLPALGVSYRNTEIAGRLKGQDFHIDRLRLMTGKKELLEGQGIVHLNPLDDPGLELAARLQDFRISDSPTLSTIASGQLRLGGTVNQPVVTGALELGPTDLFLGAEAAAAKVEPVDLTPDDLRRLARDFGPSVLGHGKESTSLLSRVRMDVQLQMPRRVWIRRRKPPEADIELRGRMRLTQRPGGDMQFAGRVEPIPGRGSLDLSGRTFRLTGGTIDLAGPIDSTHLDVTAEYQVPTQGGGEDNGVVISVEAKGRLDSLGLEFSADPDMSQEDVLSYIVTGHPASDNPLESGGGGGFSGKQVAFGQLSQAIGGVAARQLGFDVFQIKTDPATGLSLTAGRYLSNRFFLDLKLPLGSGSTSAPGDNLGPGFELEYTARRWLRADLRGGSLPGAIMFRGRHAY